MLRFLRKFYFGILPKIENDDGDWGNDDDDDGVQVRFELKSCIYMPI
jgi:hypothetical protein